jgi:PAS domain S-box-containing protein
MMNKVSQMTDTHLRYFLEHMPDGLLLLGAVRNMRSVIIDLRIDYLNPAGSQLLQRGVDTLIGRSFCNVFPDLCAEGLFAACIRTITTGEPFDEHVLAYASTNAAGHRHECYFAFRAFKWHDGVALSWRDISERVRVEEQANFRARLLDEIGQAVMVTTPDGTIVYWNRSAETTYGWQAAEVLGQNVLDVTPTPVSREQAARIMDRLRVGEQWSGEFLVQQRDGLSFTALTTVILSAFRPI